MKSTQRPSKPPKQQSQSHNPNPKPNLTPVADEPQEQHQAESQPVPSPADEPPLQSVEPPATASPHHKAQQQSKVQRPSKLHSEKPELLAERFQHVKFLDCDKPVSRIIFECWHCNQGIISEFTGSPVMGEYKGRPSIIQLKVQCPNCEQTAIRLNTGEVLSTTAIPSPWKQ
ncbi:hypothetical protein [Dendronalium sp. ChiSLP03b]|uniref:hypothetical protein n=1 Tax=Dendronalium sp. ChiSLP03b TaxID=3075381 RepID=UPI00391C133B